MTVIDIHTHIFSSDRPFPQAVLDDPQWDVSDRIGAGFRAKAEAQAHPRIETYIENMSDWGIDLVVVNNVALSVDGARAMNEFNAQIVADHPDKAIGFAAVPMAEGDAGARELEYAVTELGFHGAKIYPRIHGVPLDADSMRPMYETAAGLGVPLLTHTTAFYQAYSGTRGLDWQDLTSDNPMRLFDSGIWEANPDLKMIFAHQAGGFVYYKDKVLRLKPELEPLFENFYVDIVPATRYHSDEVRAAIEALGTDHVLFGLDFPWPSLDECARSVDHVRSMDLTSSEEAAVLGGNAIELLGLDMLMPSGD